MELLQIQIIYQADQDRLQLRLSFGGAEQEKQEIQAYLTRRLVRQLWPVCLQAFETLVTLNQPGAAHARADLVQMAHEASLQKMHEDGGFTTHFEGDARVFPRGEQPLLIHTVGFNLQADSPITLQFTPQEQAPFEIALPESLMHAFCKLLQEAVREADWGLELEMPRSEPPADRPYLLN